MCYHVDAILPIDVRRIHIDDALDRHTRIQRVVELGDLLQVEELDVGRPSMEDEVPEISTDVTTSKKVCFLLSREKK